MKSSKQNRNEEVKIVGLLCKMASDYGQPPAKRCRAGLKSSSAANGDAEEAYFKSYADLYTHEEMLRDVERTSAYRDAIMGNKELIQDKVVLDVGAGTGILSCFCALAGARKVYAIEASGVAQHARSVIEENDLTDRVVVLNERVEECNLPEKVDVIVSEWMGYSLMYESMLASVLFARDHWLKPGGLMLPSHAALFAAPVNVQRFWDDRVDIWSNMQAVYGVKMKRLRRVVEDTTLRSVQVVELYGEDVLSDSSCVVSLDLGSATLDDLQKLEGVFSVKSHCCLPMHGIGIWFVVTFPGKPPVRLSTSPYSPRTHWRQCVLFFDDPVEIEQDDLVEGRLVMTPFGSHMRFLNVHLSCDVSRRAVHVEKDYTLDDNTC